VQISAGDAYTCVRLGNGNVECWGNNDSGQLGNSSAGQENAPVTVDLNRRGALFLDAGDEHVCAVLPQSATACWGDNSDGQLNGQPGTPANTTAVPPLTLGLTGIAAPAPGGFHSCALLTAATVNCWGSNLSGELGIGTTADTTGFQPVSSLSDVRTVASGTNHSCAGTGDGKVYCWGANGSGQVGAGIGTDITRPTEIAFP
jgi:alpha-tubulin suppressor-like RCC1 family protein